MPVKVLLRGFTPDIPEDQPVTFINDLPRSVLCVQCDNVSSTLFKDPRGHGYCYSCVGMCTTEEDGFNCSTCDRNFDPQQLVEDDSTQRKLRTEKLICPRSAKSEAVEIPFQVLKAHLNGCYCNYGSGDLNRGKEDGGIRPKAVKQELDQPESVNPEERAQADVLITEEPEQPPSLQTFSISRCSICKTTMSKKHINQHMKSCLKTPQEWRGSQQCEGIAQPVAASPTSMSQMVNVLQNEISQLKRVINQKDNDILLLRETVSVLTEDVRGVRIRCENRIAKAEKSSTDFETLRILLDEYMAGKDEERKKEIEGVHANMANMANMQALYEERMGNVEQRIDGFQQRIGEFLQNIYHAHSQEPDACTIQ
ncbi:uncharacterized protein LOC144142303 isoform X2 [Haemaphysalis longicornis]